MTINVQTLAFTSIEHHLPILRPLVHRVKISQLGVALVWHSLNSSLILVNLGGGHRFMQRAVFSSSGRVFAFQDGGFCRYPSTGRRRQTGRPNARPRTGCITRRTYFLRIIFKVLRLVYYCASVGADFYSFSYRTSCDQNLSPLAQPGFWR